MEAMNIGSRREVCWDEALMNTCESIRVQMHRPEYRGDAMTCDAPWEGNASGYFTLLPDGTHYRLYYRGAQYDSDERGRFITHKETLCYAESADGKTFHKVPVNLHNWWGTANNNILSTETGDNISFFVDTNPACPPEEKYKGLCGGHYGAGLQLYTSADGVNFVKNRVLADDGAYDSLNVCFWDEIREQYYLFYRGFHGERTDGARAIGWTEDELSQMDEAGKLEAAHSNKHIRDVRVRTSEDFITWSEPRRLEYGDSDPDIQLYTNNIQPYYRAPHIFLGMPTRYTDRWRDNGISQLPDWEHRQLLMQHQEPRTGTAMTDTCLMTSRDGVNFRRTDEAFYTPGPERAHNWYYGDGYFAYGMAETASDIPGAPNEISIYTGVNYRVKGITLRRYAVRLDGFFSWRCDFKPGKVVTKPVVFQGDRLHVNFATSGAGFLRIRILDENGQALEGYDSGRHFGDSVERELFFEKPLADLNGKPVRLEITMQDADLYSFRFSQSVKIS